MYVSEGWEIFDSHFLWKLDNVDMLCAFLVFQVKLDKVDVFYPFHPCSLVDIKNDTRLKFTSQEAAAWLDDLSK